jgi:hypothetical protein
MCCLLNAAFNSLLVRCSSTAEPVNVQLFRPKRFCLPLLTYCIGVLEFSGGVIHRLAVRWTDAFRKKIFIIIVGSRVKQLQYLCGCVDFKRLYNLAIYKLLIDVKSSL